MDRGNQTDPGRLMGPHDHSEELERHFRIEFGSPLEVWVRGIGTVGAGALIFAYTGWTIAWIWSLGFVSVLVTYYLFLRARKDRGTSVDETISGLIFLLLLVSFLWMPAIMISEGDRALSICGSALVGCILVFLIRRSDSAPLMLYGEIVVVVTVIALVFLRLIPQFSDPFAKLGILASGIALLYYFVEAARMSRKLRLEAAEANQNLLQTEKIAAIGRLAGGIAHDFNNNLTAIMGHLELLALIDDPKDRATFINEAQVAAKQASMTVKQLLAFARKDRMTLEDQDAAEILDGLVALTRRLIPASILTSVERGESGQSFIADRAQLLSALINLVVNAVDAMPNGGELHLSSSVVQLDRPLNLADGSNIDLGEYVRIAVEDTGDGIAPDILGKVVEPYFTTKPVGKGTGLGLPMALGVSKELGGGLTIQSSEKGTTISVLLPTISSVDAEEQIDAD